MAWEKVLNLMTPDNLLALGDPEYTTIAQCLGILGSYKVPTLNRYLPAIMTLGCVRICFPKLFSFWIQSRPKSGIVETNNLKVGYNNFFLNYYGWNTKLIVLNKQYIKCFYSNLVAYFVEHVDITSKW